MLKKGFDYYFFCLFLILSINSFGQEVEVFDKFNQPTAPNYSETKNWAALPFHKDNADIIPNNETWVSDSAKKLDVFYIHPTIYTRKRTTWNASLDNKKINKELDNKAIRYQATAFNNTARIYAPRYRQAHIDVFDNESKLRYDALEFAYQDVKKAFEYYLNHYNNDRPIIIVSHSQGTVHARKLLKEFFDTPKMKEKLVCAYIIGFGIYPKTYKLLTPCQNAEETNCYLTWSSFKNGYNYHLSNGDYLVGETSTNPISWKMDTLLAESTKGIFLSVKGKMRYHTKARLKNNMLWIETNTPFIKSWNIMHVVDFNLFWYNIRENIALRSKKYFENIAKRK